MTVPYWRLSAFYLFYYATLGAFIPYWTLYLAGKGYLPAAIGQLMALMMMTRIVAPNVWAWLADHTGRRMRIVQLGSLAAALAFSGVFFAQHFWWLALVVVSFSFFWNASLPQMEVTTFNHLGTQAHRYGGIRLWGSIGFIVAVAGLGPLLDRFGTGLLPTVLMALFAAIWASSMWVPERSLSHAPQAHAPLREVLTQRHVAALLTICFLMQASHGPYYTFYSLYLQDHGYSRSVIGQLWALGVIAEIGVFVVLPRLVPWFGLRTLLLSSLSLALVRWLLIAYFVDSLAVLILAQVLHAATFGVYHGAAIQLIHRYFHGRLQGRGQALYSSLSFGAGGAVGALYSGYTWAVGGGALSFATAALVSGAALVFAWRGLKVAE
ncbi:MAG: MFS transporter [Gammaproteobacteria bacterium]|jgi:PPP family 3-phenylpropionic acid transporter